MSYLTELQAEKIAILKANSDLITALFEWIDKSGVTEEDAELAHDYINDMINDTIGTRLRNITNEIAELEAEEENKYPNPAKLTKGDLI